MMGVIHVVGRLSFGMDMTMVFCARGFTRNGGQKVGGGGWRVAGSEVSADLYAGEAQANSAAAGSNIALTLDMCGSQEAASGDRVFGELRLFVPGSSSR